MRTKICKITLIVGVIVALSACEDTAPVYDTLILNGNIVDGTSAASFKGDIAIVGDEIVDIGDLGDASATRIIDATGLTVTPGFIDLHNHADRNIKNSPGVENYLYQGVTTLLVGNCGSSPVHLAEYFQSIEQIGISLNIAMLIGHNSVRREVMGNENRQPTAEEQAQMELLVKGAMDEGAFGMSTGLIYLPGTFAETGEIVSLARVVAKEGGIYSSHIRNEFDLIKEAIDEAVTIGRSAKLPVHISHFKIADNNMWGESNVTLAMVEKARADGVDITVDQYPYTRGSTGLANVLPAWARAGTREELQARLDDPETRARIKAGTIKKLYGARAAGDLSRITIASFPSHPEYAGKTMAEVTRMNGREPTIENGAEVAMEILYDGDGSALYFMMDEEDVRRIMKSPFTAIASDGSAVGFGKNVPHLRNYGTFARVLGKYVREEGVLSMEEAIYKMTAMPANRIKLKRKGTLAKGMVADINIFDPSTVKANEDWSKPHQYAIGFSYVIVGGTPVIDKGVATGSRPGRVLKRAHAVKR